MTFSHAICSCTTELVWEAYLSASRLELHKINLLYLYYTTSDLLAHCRLHGPLLVENFRNYVRRRSLPYFSDQDLCDFYKVQVLGELVVIGRRCTRLQPSAMFYLELRQSAI